MGGTRKPKAKTVHLARFGRYERVLDDDDDGPVSDRWERASPPPDRHLAVPHRTRFTLADLPTITNAELDAFARHLIGRGFREFTTTLDQKTHGQATVCLRRAAWLWGLLGSRVLGNRDLDFQDWVEGFVVSALPPQGSHDDRAFPSPILRPAGILPEVCDALAIVLSGSVSDEASTSYAGPSLFVTDYGRRDDIQSETLGARVSRPLRNGAFLTALDLVLALVESQTLFRALLTGRAFAALGSRVGWMRRIPVFSLTATGTIECRGVSSRTAIGNMRCPARWTPS